MWLRLLEPDARPPGQEDQAVIGTVLGIMADTATEVMGTVLATGIKANIDQRQYEPNPPRPKRVHQLLSLLHNKRQLNTLIGVYPEFTLAAGGHISLPSSSSQV